MGTPVDYSVAQKVIHWLMAIFLTLDLFVAQKFGDVMEEFDRLDSRADHSSMGTIIAILFVIRLFLPYRNGAPALPSSMPDWQVKLAGLVHFLLYFFIGFLILSGVATAINATDPINLFGAIDITIGQSDGATFDFIRQFHEFATIAVIALIVVHVLAAFYHLFMTSDKTTQKMAKFWKSENP
jgi:cytochrome b561